MAALALPVLRGDVAPVAVVPLEQQAGQQQVEPDRWSKRDSEHT